MEDFQVYSENSRTSCILDGSIDYLIGGLLAFMPLAFGGVKDWGKEMIIALSGLITILFLLKLIIYRNSRIFRSWAYIPAGIFILLIIFQLMRLPTGLINIISPNTADLKTKLLGDSEFAYLLRSMTISFYPNGTKHDLRIILAIAGVFVVVFNSFRDISRIKRILKAIVLIGGLAALIALLQDIFGNGKIYWLVEVRKVSANSGPFVNHSHFGQFMNLSIGAALALLLTKLVEDFSDRKKTIPAVFEYFSSGSSKTVWVVSAIISLGIATVFLCLSRGGIASMLISAILTTVIISFHRSVRGHGWIMAFIGLGAFCCVLYTSFDAVYERLSTFRNLTCYENRLQVIKDMTAGFRQFPVFGTGLGTHSFVYPMYDSSDISALATHAENEYAQVLEETGLAGLGALIIFGIIILSAYIKNIRSKNLPVRTMTYGLGFGLFAILFHSISDFGQHIPANAFLTAVFCAILLALSQKEYENKMGVANRGRRGSIILRTAALSAAMAIWVWTLSGADNARLAEANWKKVSGMERNFAKLNRGVTSDEYQKLISFASQAVHYQPENIRYRYWLNVYRLRSIQPEKDNAGNYTIPDESIPTIYEIADGLDKARFLCPTFGPAYSVIGQIQKYVLEDEKGTKNIEKSLFLAPCDPMIHLACGLDDALEGRTEQAIERFKRAVLLEGGLFKNVVFACTEKINRPELAIAVAGDQIDRVSYLIEVLSNKPEYEDLIRQSRERLTKLLEKECSGNDAMPSSLVRLAEIYSKENNEKAIELYRRALGLDYAQVSWHMNLAELLSDNGQTEDAIHEAKVCLKLHPKLKAAEKLIADLSVRKNFRNGSSPAQNDQATQ